MREGLRVRIKANKVTELNLRLKKIKVKKIKVKVKYINVRGWLLILNPHLTSQVSIAPVVLLQMTDSVLILEGLAIVS